MVRAYGEQDKEFLPIAFFDMSMVVTLASCIRDFVLFGDIMHSITFVGFQVTNDSIKLIVGRTISDDASGQGL
jgi:hypothetical protein